MCSGYFYVAARQFVKKVIRVRFGLIRRGYSNNQDADRAARELNMQLDYFAYDTDIKMASFFARYEEEILEAIPGGKSKCSQRLISEYYALLEKAKLLNAKT